MASEAARGLARMGANYVRLLATLLLGLIVVPIQLVWLGKEAFGLLSLVVTAVGIGAMILDVVERSMIRELGAAYHSKSDARFLSVYNSALVVCLVAGAATAAVFGVIILLAVPLFNIAPPLVTPAKLLIVCDALLIIPLTLLAPAINMFVVAERFIAYNVYWVLLRFNYVLPVLVLYYGMRVSDPARALTLYAYFTAGLHLLLVAATAAWIMWQDRRLVPRPWLATRPAAREVAGTFGWNSSVTVALGLHERMGPIIGNLAFGPAALVWNAAFGLAMRLVAYVRMAALGMTLGLDAVSARLSSGDQSQSRVHRLVYHSTRLHAFVAIPAGVAVFLLAEPMLQLWVGRNTPDAVPPAVPMVKILVFAIAARAISDAWISVIYGAGHIRRIAPLILIGSVLNPVATVVLLAAAPAWLEPNVPAIAFAVVFTAVHFVALPLIAAPCLGLRRRQLFTPLVRPLLITAACTPVFLVALDRIEHWTLLHLFGVCGVFGVLYGVLSILFFVRREERDRVVRALLARLGRWRPPPPPPQRGETGKLEPTDSSTATGL